MDALYEVAKVVFVERKEELIETAMYILESVLGESNEGELKSLQRKKENVMSKREVLLDKMLDGVISDDLFKRKDSTLEAEYKEIQSKITSIEEYIKKREQKIQRLAMLRDEVIDITDRDLVMDKLLDYVEKITVHHNYAMVEFTMFESVRINIEKKGYKTVIMSV